MSGPNTVADLLHRAARIGAAGEREAGLRFLGRRHTVLWRSWQEIAAAAIRIAGGLRGLGIERGEVVPLAFPTGPGFVEAFFALLLAGAVPAPLQPPLRLGRQDDYTERTARLLRAVEARLVIADPTLRGRLEAAATLAGARLSGCGLDELPALCAATALPALAAGDPALVQFSSGTTGEPQPVLLEHGALVAQAEILNRYWPDAAEHRHSGVSWLPLYHDMGLVGCLLPAVERPGVLTLLPPELFVARPVSWLRAISEYRATLSAAPNFAFRLCVDRIADRELEGLDLRSWRLALNGAETIAAADVRAFVERFAGYGLRAEAVTPVYGLAEAALAVTFSDPRRPFRSCRFDRDLLAQGRAVRRSDGRELVSVGRAVPGFEVRICDAAGRDLAPQRVGRVLARGPSLMRGYVGRPEQTAAVLRDGWLDTGDLGFLARGELYLYGRSRDLLIVRGRNHAPEPIEQLVGALPGVRPGSVVAVSDYEAGEEVRIFAERRAPGVGRETDRAVAETGRQRLLAEHGIEAHISLLPPGALPRTTSGKLRRREALRRFRDHRT